MSVSDVCHFYCFDRKNLEDCKKVIRNRTLSPGWRKRLKDRLEKAGIGFDRKQEPEDSMCCGRFGDATPS